MRSGHFLKSYENAIALSDSRATWFWICVLLVVAAVAPFVLQNAYFTSLLTRIFIISVGVIGLTLLTGCTGLISLGQSAFMALGGYTVAILTSKFGWPLELALPMASVVAAVASLLVGVPSLRLKGLYLAITTLAFGFIVNHVILYGGTLTNGSRGIVLTRLNFFGFNVASPTTLYFTTLLLLVLCVFAALNIKRSALGRAWIAIRDHDIAARAMGIGLARYKLLSFVVSSAFVGLSGALLALELQVVNVDVFGLLLSIEALAIILLGGLGSIGGAIIGSFFLILLPDTIGAAFGLLGDDLGARFSNYLPEFKAVLYGVIIVAILRIEPRGLIGVWNNTRRFWSQWPLSISK